MVFLTVSYDLIERMLKGIEILMRNYRDFYFGDATVCWRYI